MNPPENHAESSRSSVDRLRERLHDLQRPHAVIPKRDAIEIRSALQSYVDANRRLLTREARPFPSVFRPRRIPAEVKARFVWRSASEDERNRKLLQAALRALVIWPVDDTLAKLERCAEAPDAIEPPAEHVIEPPSAIAMSVQRDSWNSTAYQTRTTGYERIVPGLFSSWLAARNAPDERICQAFELLPLNPDKRRLFDNLTKVATASGNTHIIGAVNKLQRETILAQPVAWGHPEITAPFFCPFERLALHDALLDAVLLGLLDVVSAILDFKQANRSDLVWTLNIAAEAGNADIVRILLNEEGVNLAPFRNSVIERVVLDYDPEADETIRTRRWKVLKVVLDAGTTPNEPVLRLIEHLPRMLAMGVFAVESDHELYGLLLTGIRTMLENLGFPSVFGVDEDERQCLLRQVSTTLARMLITFTRPTLADRKFFWDITQIRHDSKEWHALEQAAQGFSTLQQLASESMIPDTGWRALCERLGCAHLSNQRHDMQARRHVTIESFAVGVHDGLMRAAALDSELRYDHVITAVETRRHWRRLAVILRREDLIGRSDDAAARELAIASLKYRGTANLRPLMKKAGLEELRLRDSIRQIADRVRIGKQREGRSL